MRPRSPSARVGCSTSARPATGRQCLAPPPGAFPSPGGPPVGNAPGRWRRSCCRRAPTWSGCATTWASSTTQPSPTSWRHRWMMPTVWCSCRHRWVWARPTGTTAPAAASSASRVAAPRHTSPGAVLEGVAQRGAELLAAAEADSGASIDALRVDGGMSQNRTFIQALANAIQRPVEVSPVLEATARGGGLAAGVALGLVRVGTRHSPTSGNRRR
jgi:sugar (pentulose or hexulose) kinase